MDIIIKRDNKGKFIVAADLLIYALVAAGLVFWLRNILGTRTGDERERPNPFTQRPDNSARPQKAPATAEEAVMGAAMPGTPEPALLERHMSVGTMAAEQGLGAISRAYREFTLPHFLHGAQDAFIMIVEAFARGDRETLRNLLAPAVYDGFDAALRDRAAQGMSSQVEIHAVRKIEVLDARLDGRMAYITVKFIADETNVLRNSQGDLLSGHPDRVTETIDIWVFGRDLNARGPEWLVYETREGAEEEAGAAGAPDHLS